MVVLIVSQRMRLDGAGQVVGNDDETITVPDGLKPSERVALLADLVRACRNAEQLRRLLAAYLDLESRRLAAGGN